MLFSPLIRSKVARSKVNRKCKYELGRVHDLVASHCCTKHSLLNFCFSDLKEMCCVVCVLWTVFVLICRVAKPVDGDALENKHRLCWSTQNRTKSVWISISLLSLCNILRQPFIQYIIGMLYCQQEIKNLTVNGRRRKNAMLWNEIISSQVWCGRKVIECQKTQVTR